MTIVVLELQGEIYFCPVTVLIQRTGLFKNNPELGRAPYAVQAEVSPEALRAFIWTLEGKPICATQDTLAGFELLCQEFDCPDLLDAIQLVEAPSSAWKHALGAAIVITGALILIVIARRRR
jgi:hypothetical protein